MELDGGGGEMHITMPYSMVEPIREILDAGLQSDSDERDDRWVNALREDIMDAKIDLETEIVSRELTLRDIVDLRPGDIIPSICRSPTRSPPTVFPCFKRNWAAAAKTSH